MHVLEALRKAVTHKRQVFGTLLLWVIVNSMGAIGASAQSTKHVVLIAGTKSHGPGEHEYLKSIKLIKALLDRAPNLEHVQTEIYFNGWPDDTRVLDRADTIVILSDGEDGSDLFHAPFVTEERMKALEKQMNRGCGFITFHFSTFTPAKYASQILEWTGGYFDWQSGHGEGGFYGVKNDGPRQQWHSVIRFMEADVKLGAPQHPIANGVSPFHLKDEFSYQLAFREKDSRLQPILRLPALSSKPEDQIVAWAVERENGGRGFATTSGHYFEDWQNDNYRKLILNAIVWTAGMTVPRGGVISSYMNENEVNQALMKRPIPTLLVTGGNSATQDWKNTASSIVAALNSEVPRFDVFVADDSQVLAKDLSRYRLIVLNNCGGIRLDNEAQKNFARHLRTAGGLTLIYSSKDEPDPGAESNSGKLARICEQVMWKPGSEDNSRYLSHMSQNDFKRLPQDQQKLIMDDFNRLPEDEKKLQVQALSRVMFKVTIIDRNHPAAKNVSDFQMVRLDTPDDLDFDLPNPGRIHVIAVVRSHGTGQAMPMAFASSYSKTRIYHSIPGRLSDSLIDPKTMQMIRYGSLWAAGQ